MLHGTTKPPSKASYIHLKDISKFFKRTALFTWSEHELLTITDCVRYVKCRGARKKNYVRPGTNGLLKLPVDLKLKSIAKALESLIRKTREKILRYALFVWLCSERPKFWGQVRMCLKICSVAFQFRCLRLTQNRPKWEFKVGKGKGSCAVNRMKWRASGQTCRRKRKVSNPWQTTDRLVTPSQPISAGFYIQKKKRNSPNIQANSIHQRNAIHAHNCAWPKFSFLLRNHLPTFRIYAHSSRIFFSSCILYARFLDSFCRWISFFLFSCSLIRAFDFAFQPYALLFKEQFYGRLLENREKETRKLLLFVRIA